ncbi:Polysaccharide deacetylase [Phycisphaerae bacterium RAS1]|nr:Polysaccharide deacetylase [Phycisphaerae bacterium RAS1]
MVARLRSLLKQSLALGVSLTLTDRLMFAAQKSRLGKRFIRVINCHDTPHASIVNYRRQLAWYARHFVGASDADLRGLLEHGEWNKPKPGLIISFDDGLRTNFDVAAPLLEEYGFVGWHFVPLEFIDTPREQQRAYAAAHSIVPSPSGDRPPNRGVAADSADAGRVAMSWDELRDLVRRGHVVGCHTRTHHRLTASTPPAQLDDEIITCKRDLEQRLGSSVDHFCWVGGEEFAYSREAAQRIRDAGYRCAFMTCSNPCVHGTNPLQLHRTNVECTWPMHIVRLQLCGIADRANAAKRRRVEALTAL